MTGTSAADPRRTPEEEVSICLLLHNRHPSPGGPVLEKRVSAARHAELLASPGRVACPLPERLGLPLVLVPVSPGMNLAARPDNHRIDNNQRATYLSVDLASGFASDWVVGNAYALRTDGRSFTMAEWALLDDALNLCMDIYADRKMTSGVLDGLRSSLHRQIYGCSDDELEEALDARCAR